MPTKTPGRELLILYGITLAVTVAYTLLQGIPLVGAYGMILVAGVFLYLPIEVLERQGVHPASFGIHRRQPLRAARWAGLAMLIAFPPFLAGHYVWQTAVQEQTLQPARYDRFSDTLAGPPLTPLGQDEARLFTDDRETVWYEWRFADVARVEITVQSAAPLHIKAGAHLAKKQGRTTRFTGIKGGRIAFDAPSSFTLSATADGREIPADKLLIGAGLTPAEDRPYTADRSWWWLLNLILGQLLVVALPEEIFYRGYIQTRLDSLVGGERTVFGVQVNPLSIVLTSALFAFGHFATIPAAYRLAVFFPSLAFGWLRRASGGVLAPLLFHAACNVVARLAGLHYS